MCKRSHLGPLYIDLSQLSQTERALLAFVSIKAQLIINYNAQVLVRLNDFNILTINFSVDRVGVKTSEINTHILSLCHI